jgi:VCBS repeat-containing protein
MQAVNVKREDPVHVKSPRESKYNDFQVELLTGQRLSDILPRKLGGNPKYGETTWLLPKKREFKTLDLLSELGFLTEAENYARKIGVPPVAVVGGVADEFSHRADDLTWASANGVMAALALSNDRNKFKPWFAVSPWPSKPQGPKGLFDEWQDRSIADLADTPENNKMLNDSYQKEADAHPDNRDRSYVIDIDIRGLKRKVDPTNWAVMDIGIGNMQVRTAIDLYIKYKDNPDYFDADQRNWTTVQLLKYVITPKGTAHFTALDIREGQEKLSFSGLNSLPSNDETSSSLRLSEPLLEGVLVEYYKRGQAWLDAYANAAKTDKAIAARLSGAPGAWAIMQRKEILDKMGLLAIATQVKSDYNVDVVSNTDTKTGAKYDQRYTLRDVLSFAALTNAPSTNARSNAEESAAFIAIKASETFKNNILNGLFTHAQIGSNLESYQDIRYVVNQLLPGPANQKKSVFSATRFAEASAVDNHSFQMDLRAPVNGPLKIKDGSSLLEVPDQADSPTTNSDYTTIASADLWTLGSLQRSNDLNKIIAAASMVVRSIESLPGNAVGESANDGITLDDNAAGNGWFVDATPDDNAEFLPTANPNEWIAKADSEAANKMDLLSVLLHEYGHVLGIEHSADGHDFMAATLQPGVRRLPTVEELALMLQLIGQAKTTMQADVSGSSSMERIASPEMLSTEESSTPHYQIAINSAFGNTPDAWQTSGNVEFGGAGQVTLGESETAQSQLSQGFVINPNDRYLRFTLSGIALDDVNNAPDDAFEVALLDANNGASLKGGTGLTRSDAILNIQASGNEHLAPGVSSILNPDGSRTYLVDLVGIPAGTAAYLSFDLIGFGATTSHATVSDLRLLALPQTRDDAVATDEDTPLQIDALANDINAIQSGFIPVIVTGPAHGQVTVNPDGSFRYTPDKDWNGEDSFAYRLSDGAIASNEATVTLTINAVNDAPTLADQSASLAEDGSLTLQPLTAAQDADGDLLAARIITGPAHGTLEFNTDGTWTYTPEANYYGPDSYTYVVNDGSVDSTIATVHLTVTPVNDAPVLTGSSATVKEGDNLVINPLANTTDIDGDLLTVRIVSGPSHGTLAQNPDGSMTYRSNDNYAGPDSYSYVVNDGQADSNSATVDITVIPNNHAPEAGNQALSTNEDAVFTGSLFANATDLDGDALTATVIAVPTHGTLTVHPDGSFNYTPATNWSGEDSFTYQVSDGKLTSNIATVKLTIVPVADAPTLQLGDASTTQRLFTTQWEGAANIDSQSTLIRSDVLDGWRYITRTGQYDKGEGHACDEHGEGQGLGGGKDGFEIWSSGDQMVDNRNQAHTVSAAPGNGNNWLELNDAGGSQHQTLGISRQIDTVQGALYTLGLDVAGRLGYGSATTRIGIYVDDQKIATLDNTSPSSALAWQHAQVNFTGNGGSQTIRIVTEATDREFGGRGMMIDDITLDQVQSKNHGNAGSLIPLQGIEAALTDTDGSETLHLMLAGLPVGSVLTDGTHSLTTTVDQLIADITDWNTQALTVTPPLTSHGTYDLKIMAVAMESANASEASATQTIHLQVDAVAQTPTLNLLPPAGSLSRSLVETSWEGQCNPDSGATILERDQLDGWHTQPAQKGKKSAFIVWSNNDQMSTANNQRIKAQAMTGAGKQWLALTNGAGASGSAAAPGGHAPGGYGINSGADKRYQNLGIEREIDTIAGAQYTLSLDYAGALAATNTRIVVTLDGQAIGSYANESGNALNWQALNFTFTGDGEEHQLAIQLEASGNAAAGAMLDAINLVETLPNSANTVYGIRGTAIALPVIDSKRAGDDPGSLKTELLGLPKGATLTDGKNQTTIKSKQSVIDITGWTLNKLSLILPNDANESLDLQVRATCTEANGSNASTTRNLTVKLLDGQSCATPSGMNPYVRYANDTAATTTGPGSKPTLSASPLKTEDRSCGIYVPGVSSHEHEELEGGDKAIENWMTGLEHSLSMAFMEEMEKVLRNER